MRHRCAVCWERQADHQAWLEHVESAHGATVAEFGWSACPSHRNCPGIEHEKKLPDYGTPPGPRRRPEPQPFTARDGTTYVPVRLFGGEPSA